MIKLNPSKLLGYQNVANSERVGDIVKKPENVGRVGVTQKSPSNAARVGRSKSPINAARVGVVPK